VGGKLGPQASELVSPPSTVPPWLAASHTGRGQQSHDRAKQPPCCELTAARPPLSRPERQLAEQADAAGARLGRGVLRPDF